MELNNHLLYIDITNQCNLNCEFCMYKEEREKNPQELQLDIISKRNISNIMNDISTERVIISGEGEPFNNFKAINAILNISKGNNKFQIITSGLWFLAKNKENILKTLNQLSIDNVDKYQIRVSCDSFHIDKIGKENYKKILIEIIKIIKGGTKLEIGFRGILEEKNIILKDLKKMIESNFYDVILEEVSGLETNIIIDNNIILNFIFKNIVDLDDIKKVSTLNEYIDSLEKIYNKPFTLGHMKKESNGMDITIKPNGDLFFYGIEIYPIFNIFKDNITIENLLNVTEENFILNTLYTKPFKDLMYKFQTYPLFKETIIKVNNPYWIIKKMYSLNSEMFEKLIK